MMGKTPNSIEKLMLRVNKTPSGCWEWTGSLTVGGYGQSRYLGKLWRAHRLFYTLLIGPIPPKTMICHHCDNPKCVNPDHFFLGDNQDNLTDMAKKGRARNQYTGKLNL